MPLPPPTPSERAFELLLDRLERDEARERIDGDDAGGFVRGLFARRERLLERDPFDGIESRAQFVTKVLGVSFAGRQDLVRGLAAGAALALVREPENAHDPQAIAVCAGALRIGYLRREIAARIAPLVDDGARYEAEATAVTGGGEKHLGLNLLVRRRDAPRRATAARPERATDAETVRRALLGEHVPHAAQRETIARLDAGDSVLAVFGTGRGKSYCFQDVAARRALATGAKTLVLYPLRALAGDQYAGMTRTLAPLGLRIFRADGSISVEDRRALEAALRDGSWDLVLATPEFARAHRAAFARPCNRVALAVVDEAHHCFESPHREAYAELGKFLREIGAEQRLALTATAGDAAFATIRERLEIDRWVIDPTVRTNLETVDARNTADKAAYLRGVFAAQTKAVVYCNSRAEATKIAEAARAVCGDGVAFYHAGLGATDRAAVERFFRTGEIRVVVATSAFGEGIDLPDVRDVVLYHLNFNFTEFNQQAGRAGRDGAPARIHLLYGESDRRINAFILARSAPTLEVLRELYRGLRRLATDDVLRLPHEEVARILGIETVAGATVAAALRIFEEGGLVASESGDDGGVRFVAAPERTDLTKTARYAEGLAEREAFERFRTLALEADAATLRQIVDRPIYPSGVALTV